MNDFKAELREMIRLAGEGLGSPESPEKSMLAKTGDGRGRIRAFLQDNNRDLSEKDIGSFSKYFSELKKSRKHADAGQPIFSEERLLLFKSRGDEYVSKRKDGVGDISVTFRLPYPQEAKLRLEKHYGFVPGRSSDEVVHAILSDPIGPFALRAMGRGQESLNLFSCFCVLGRKRFFQKFSAAGNANIDFSTLGGTSWTLMQYGLKYRLNELGFLIERNSSDDFATSYLNYTWPFYDGQNKKALEALNHAVLGRNTGNAVYGDTRKGARAVDYYQAGVAARDMGIPLGVSDRRLCGLTIEGLFIKAKNMDMESFGKTGSIYDLEDAATAYLGLARTYIERSTKTKKYFKESKRYIDKARATIKGRESELALKLNAIEELEKLLVNRAYSFI